MLLTDKCGFNEVEDAGGGSVVAVQADAIATGIDCMLHAAGELPSKGEKLRQLVLTHYTWDGLTRDAWRLYEELAGAISRSKPANLGEKK